MAEINPKPGTIDEKTGLRSFTPEESAKAVEAAAKTGDNTHRATARGYAIPAGTSDGVLIEDGEIVPANVPISEEWMEPLNKKTARLTDAVNEAQQDHPTDVDLTKLDKAALQAMAAERGINVDGLGKADLITAIKAEREPTI
jgi:hypothetical protein